MCVRHTQTNDVLSMRLFGGLLSLEQNLTSGFILAVIRGVSYIVDLPVFAVRLCSLRLFVREYFTHFWGQTSGYSPWMFGRLEQAPRVTEMA
jgi:hypothetical protein